MGSEKEPWKHREEVHLCESPKGWMLILRLEVLALVNWQFGEQLHTNLLQHRDSDPSFLEDCFNQFQHTVGDATSRLTLADISKNNFLILNCNAAAQVDRWWVTSMAVVYELVAKYSRRS